MGQIPHKHSDPAMRADSHLAECSEESIRGSKCLLRVKAVVKPHSGPACAHSPLPEGWTSDSGSSDMVLPEKFVNQIGDFWGVNELVDKSELCFLVINV